MDRALRWSEIVESKNDSKEGQSLIIYSEELEAEGVVHYSEEEKLWTAVIDWHAIQEVDTVVPQITPHTCDLSS